MDRDIFDKAQAIMTNRRMSAVSENERRIREINEKLPQIKEVNDVLFNTGKELISIISSGNRAEIDLKIQQLRNYNNGAQSMAKKILAENGYPENYLDIQYNCPICSDTGYNGSRFCSCFNKLCGKLSADALNKNAQLKLSSFDSFRLTYYQGDAYFTMKRILEFTQQYAATFSPKTSSSIFMTGRTGLGKTHLSLAIANTVLSSGYSVIYDSVINILRNIEREHFSREHSSEMIDLVMDTELLILDDLGTEYETQFYNATIYNIINTRLNSGKPTIISTNLDFKGISGRYDERVVSRIVSVYKYLQFQGEDVRMQIRKTSDT